MNEINEATKTAGATDGRRRGAGRLTRAERGLIAVSAAAVFVVGGGALWWQRASEFPNVVIPEPVLPVPNAYDFYVKAEALAVGAVPGGASGGAATGFAPVSTDTGGAKTGRGGSPLAPVADRMALVALNWGAVETLRRGFAHPFVQPPDRSLSTPGPGYAKWRALARLLAFASRTCLDARQPNEAARYALDGVRLGTDVPRGGGYIAWLVARACEQISRKPLWDIAKTCDAATARTAARRLETIEQGRGSLRDTLTEEKYSGVVSLREYFATLSVNQIAREIVSNRAATTGASATVGGTTFVSPLAVGQVQAQIMMKGKGRIIRDNMMYWDRAVAVSKIPYGARPVLPRPPSDPVNEQFTLDLDTLFLRAAESHMAARLLAVRFALRAYQLEKNDYPATLADLVRAGYLQAVPGDPFAVPGPKGALPPLGYRRINARKFVLYSVGPDSRDDGGRPINNPLNRGAPPAKLRQKNYVEAGTKGDFVVGVNAY